MKTQKELEQEIARLTGQIVMARAVIELLLQLVSVAVGRDVMAAIRKKLGDVTVVPEGAADDDFVREGLDHFKKRLLERLGNDDV